MPLKRLQVGAAERQLLVERLGDGRQWRAVAVGLPLQRAFADHAG